MISANDGDSVKEFGNGVLSNSINTYLEKRRAGVTRTITAIDREDGVNGNVAVTIGFSNSYVADGSKFWLYAARVGVTLRLSINDLIDDDLGDLRDFKEDCAMEAVSVEVGSLGSLGENFGANVDII